MKYILTMMFLVILGSPVVSGTLVDAAKTGDTELVTRLLDEGADVNEADGAGTALHWAAFKGYTPVVQLLVSRGANPNLLSNMLGTPLHAAVQKDHAAVVTLLASGGADTEVYNSKKFTPLHLAVTLNRVDVVRALIEAGADVNAVGIPTGGRIAHGETSPLHLAIRHDNEEIANMLIAAGTFPRPIEEVDLTLGDPDRGREVARIHCSECHALEAGDDLPMQPTAGPPLIGVANRTVADLPGFEYSDALKRFGGNWTANRLYTFTRYPMLTVPGTKMFWTKQTNLQERVDLIIYLMIKD